MSGCAIGICAALERARWGPWEDTVTMLPRSYAAAVQAAGGLALLLPPDEAAAEAPDPLLDRLDALILAGGSDVDPADYGAAPHPETGGTWPERDRFELALARRALERDMPLLGVCRGMQIVNVALGGTLVQHLPDTARRRRAPSHPRRVRRPRGAAGARLARRRGGRGRPGDDYVVAVKSHHHQGLDELGEGLVASGWSVSDDLVEAIELPGHRFALCVLWHPGGGRAERRDRVAGRGNEVGGEARVIKVVEPATERVMAEVPSAGVEETDAAVARAKEAFPAWRAVAPGRPRRPAPSARRRARRPKPATWRRWRRATPASRSATPAARWGWWWTPSATTPAAPERLLGQTIPVAGGVDMTFREPLGVVGLIVPWNFPLLIASWKVAPALAAGNTVVLKPAALTPLTRPGAGADRARRRASARAS